jgi:hypothetical protein
VKSQFPRASIALSEANSIELLPGETLFIPAFTWLQMEWLQTGIAVSHFGWAEALNAPQIAHLYIMKEIWPQMFHFMQSFEKEWGRLLAIRYLAFGMHPSLKDFFPGSPV